MKSKKVEVVVDFSRCDSDLQVARDRATQIKTFIDERRARFEAAKDQLIAVAQKFHAIEVKFACMSLEYTLSDNNRMIIWMTLSFSKAVLNTSLMAKRITAAVEALGIEGMSIDLSEWRVKRFEAKAQLWF